MSDLDPRSPVSLGTWLADGPFMLAMSSGFFGFFAHCGMLEALEEARLTPSRVSGSSAGALVASLWASGLSAREIRDALLVLRREDFWDPAPGLGLLRGRLFRRRLESLLGVATFEECRVPLALSTYDGLRLRTRVISSGPLAPAVHASCAVPLLFQPVWLRARPHWDGGVSDRHGIAGLPPTGRLLYHHLSSRSPWRRPNSPALRPPDRPDTVSLIISGLPRLGPNRLAQAPEAHRAALAATRAALALPVVDRRVEIGTEGALDP